MKPAHEPDMRQIVREPPVCVVTGRIAGDSDACGDCDPCSTSHAVPDAVKRLLAEKDEWRNKYADAIQAAPTWQPIETAPKDVEILLGWWRDWPERKWEQAVGLAGSTKGGWLHGQATHWMFAPEPPK